MQKRLAVRMNGLMNERGSTLVSAVALCAIMGIGIAGLMGLTRNTVSQEADAHDDAVAFQAAEGGLRMLTDWVVQVGAAKMKSNNAPVDVNGVDVTLEISRPDGWLATNPTTERHWLLSSTAYMPMLAYKKKVQWVVDVPQSHNPADFGAIIADATKNPIQNQQFDGPVHFNTPINFGNLNSVAGLSFRGPVTVHDTAKKIYDIPNQKNVVWADYNLSDETRTRDHRYGAFKTSGNSRELPKLEEIKNIFQNKYDPYEDYLKVDIEYPTGVTQKDIVTDGTAHTLRFSFESGKSYYTLINSSGTLIDKQELSLSQKYILTSNGNLTVEPAPDGTGMRGKVTVETIGGKEITLNLEDGHIRYNWFKIDDAKDFESDGGGGSNANKKLNDAAVNRFHETASNYDDVLAFYSDKNLTIKTASSDSRALTAQIFAVNDGSTFIMSNSEKGVSVIGTVSSNLYWNSHPSHKVITGHFHDVRAEPAPGVIIVRCDKNGENCQKLNDGDVLSLPRWKWRETNIPL